MKNKYIPSDGTNGAEIIKKFTEFDPECNTQGWTIKDANQDIGQYWCLDSDGVLMWYDNLPEGYTEYVPSKEDIKPTEESGLKAKEFLQQKGIHPTEPIYWDLGDTTISLHELMQDYANQQTTELKKEIEELLKTNSQLRKYYEDERFKVNRKTEQIHSKTKEIEELKKEIEGFESHGNADY